MKTKQDSFAISRLGGALSEMSAKLEADDRWANGWRTGQTNHSFYRAGRQGVET